MNDFVLTTAIKKLRKLTKRIRVVPGSTSAGKTYGILPLLIDHAARIPNLEISVVSESVPHLRKGALKDFLKIMKGTYRYNDSAFNRTLLTYTFANGSYIEFFSADQEDKVRGPRRNVLYINEANNITFETYHQLSIRTSETVWLDFNPANEFWAHTELEEDEDAEWLRLTYKDNEALSPAIIKEIEKAKYKAYHDPEGNIDSEINIKNSYWANWWRVYGLGLRGMLEGVVFTNWRQVDRVPTKARFVGRGLDFGYSNDPTAIVNVYYCDQKYILDEVCYRTGMVNSAIACLLDNRAPTYADSAEPKSIEEIKRCGISEIRPTTKGADSINYGIQLMQGIDMLVTSDSTNLIKELRNYCWSKDKNGIATNKPQGRDHAIDAARYFFMMELAQPEFQDLSIELSGYY